MADNIQFRVDAVLGDTQQLQQQLNNLKTSLTLSIDNQRALQAIQQVQQRVDSLRQSISGINLNLGGANGGLSSGLNGSVNSAQRLQQIMQGVGLQMDRVRTVNGQWDSVTQRVGDRYSNITRTLTANNNLTETTTNNYQRLQSDMDAFHQRNLSGIDFEIQKREMASQRFSQQIKEQMQLQAQQQQQLNALGMDTGNALNTSSIKDIETLKTALSSANIGWNDNTHSIKNFSQQVDSAGNTITKFTTRHKTVENGVEVWKDTSYAVSDADGKLRQYSQSQNQVLNTQQSLSTMLTSAIERFAVWGIAMKVWTGVGEAISDCINYAKDLDSAMTNIRVVTMDTKEATQELLDSYNQMGQELGASTTDIASGAVDWLRQGYSQEDTTELVRTSTVLSKLAMLDNAEATEYLTSALKGYKLEAQDAMGVVDQLTAIDLEAATSAGDMAEAMSRTANMARTTGIEMNELLGMIATTAEVTQNSASTVGNSIKTVLSRMSNVKAGANVDEFGESLNDVETVLGKVGIALRTNDGEWRDFFDVLDEIANRWNDFNATQQSQITTALGGTRQRENILVMLENWDKVQQYAQTGSNSAGTAMEKYGIILESVEAKQAQLTAKVEEFYSNILNGGAIAGLLDIGKAFMDVMNAGDGLIGKILLLNTAMIALNVALNALKGSKLATWFSTLGTTFTQLTTKATTFSGALQALNINPVILGITAISTLLMIGKTAWDAYQEGIQKTIDKANELTESFNSSNQEIQNNIDSLTSGSGTYSTLSDEFEDLCKGVDEYGNNISLTSDQYERYKSICEQIVALNPDLIDGYDSETEAIGNKNNLIQQTIDLLREQQKEEARQYAEKSDELFTGYTNQYDKNLESAINNGKGVMPYIYQVGSENGDIGFFDGWDSTDAIKNNIDKILQDTDRYYEEAIEWLESRDYSEDAINTFKENYSSWIDGIEEVRADYSDDMQGVYLATAKSMDGYYDLGVHSKSFLNDYIKESFKIDPSLSEEESKKAVDAYTETTKKMVEAMSNDTDGTIEKALSDFYKIDTDKINIDDYRTKMGQIFNQIKSEFSQQGIEINTEDLRLVFDYDDTIKELEDKAQTINALVKEITNTDGFEDGADAVRDYFSGLDTTELERARLVLQLFSDDAGNLNTTLINSIDDLDAYVQQFVGVDEALNGVVNGFNKATDAKNKFQQAMSNTVEYDDNFNSYTSAVEALQEEFDNGTVGSKKFATACKYLFGEGFDVTNVDEAYEKLQQVSELFADGSYGEGMLEQLSEIDSKFWSISQNADGSWDIDIDTSAEGIKAMAEALGTTEEGVWSCLEALQMLGGVEIFDTEGIEDFATQFKMVEEVTTSTGEKLQAINVDNLRDTLEKAGVNAEYLGEAIQGLADKGYVLLDTTANADTLKASLEQLGLIASDGTVNIDTLATSLSNLGYSNDQIADVLTTLQQLKNEGGNITFTTDTGAVESAQGKIDELKTKAQSAKTEGADPLKDGIEEVDNSSLSNVQGEFQGLTTEANNATSAVNATKTAVQELDGTTATTYINTVETTTTGDGTVGLNGIGNNFSGISHLNGTAFTRGKWGATKTEEALISEVAPEIWVHADTGKWELVTNPQFVRVKKGDVIFNAKQTADLLGKGSSLSFGSSFLNGTAFYSGTVGKWKDRDYYWSDSDSDYDSDYSSGYSSSDDYDYDYDDSSSSSSSSSEKEWWEEELEELKDNLDYNIITMNTYVDGLEKLLSQLSKGTEAWKEVNKELQEAKVDNLTDQFKRGEISLNSYIKQITKVRDSYKKNTEAWKEYNDLIHDTKLKDINDQYDRSKITLDEYIEKLCRLSDTYKAGSEQEKEFEKTIMDLALESATDKYERGTISLQEYIEELKYLRGHYRKNTEEWKKYDDLIKETHLDALNQQFNDGEITIVAYVKQLEKLRKTYKKNSEEYKELTQQINDSKADYYADRYERGEISLKSYLKQLKKLRDSYVENSEKWKEYNDLMIDTRLEDYLNNLHKAVEKYSDAISRLGEVNTSKEQTEYAKLLSKEYQQVEKNLAKVQNHLANTNLTQSERNALLEEEKDLLQQQVSIRDEIENSVRQYYENEKEVALQRAEGLRKVNLYFKEVSLYGEDGKELWEYNNNKQIKALEKQVEARNAEREALKEINEREELENDLLQAKLNLQNALNNKTTKILTKQADGTWGYTFSANMSDVQKARDEVDTAQKALDDFDWEQETKALERQIDELNKNAQELADQYEDTKLWEDRLYEQTVNSIEKAYGDIGYLVEEWMSKYGTDSQTLTNAYQSLTKSNTKLEETLVEIASSLEAYFETVGFGKKVEVTKSFDTGGEIVGSGVALVHDKERVLTQQQNLSFMKLLDNIESANKLIDVSKVNIQNYRQLGSSLNTNQEPTTVIQSVSCNFPNITTTDGLQQAILALPRLARQQK